MQNNNNQNMMMNNQANNQMNFNGNQNNLNLKNINNYSRKKYAPNNNDSVYCTVEQNNSSIDPNEVNEIKNIIQLTYVSFFSDNDTYLSDLICEEIKKRFDGEWFVFVCNINDDFNFSFSTISNNEILILKFGTTKISIAKIK